jgi:hypothetical protein
MRRRKLAAAVGCMAAVFVVSTGWASAATTVGNNCVGNGSEVAKSIVSLKNPPGYSLPSAIPSQGVITSWKLAWTGPIPTEIEFLVRLKVFAPAGTDQYKVVGESAPGPVAEGSSTFPTRIPVHGGDLLGSDVSVTVESETLHGYLFCATGDPGDEVALIAGDPTIGTTAPAAEHMVGRQNPISVTVEPDADGDGYGDETQDKCPTDASTQGDCPKPPPLAPPITIGASAAAKKGLVLVTLTTSAQANVTVTGTAKLGKGKTATLNGGTQVVSPGALARIPVLFPAKLTAALKQLPKSKKLTLDLSASAPGATTTNLTVKVPGQLKPRPRHHHK